MKKWGYVIIKGWYWWDPLILIDHNRSVVAKTVKIKCSDQL
jgi:RNA polymerase subunit RPABC4/transcription elongation factor Spt4